MMGIKISVLKLLNSNEWAYCSQILGFIIGLISFRATHFINFFLSKTAFSPFHEPLRVKQRKVDYLYPYLQVRNVFFRKDPLKNKEIIKNDYKKNYLKMFARYQKSILKPSTTFFKYQKTEKLFSGSRRIFWIGNQNQLVLKKKMINRYLLYIIIYFTPWSLIF